MNRRQWLLAATSLLAGCGASTQRPSLSTLVGKPTLAPVDGRYVADHFTVALPAGWLRRPLSGSAVVASRDGFLLQSIVVERRAIDKAFPLSKKAARPDALSTELAEQEIAELKAGGSQLAALEVLENDPATLGGTEGFRLMYRHRTSRGLVVQHVVHGCATPNGYYRTEYLAPALHYFAPTLPDYESTVASLTFSLPAKPAM